MNQEPSMTNQRMIELYQEASEFAYKICREEGRDGGTSDHIWNMLSTGKFAELIVRECMKESMEEIVSDDEIAQEKDPLIREYLNGNNQGIVDAVVRFRNHFGVEE